MGPDEIRQELAEWKRNSDRRDTLVKLAHGAGIQIKEISQITGLSRTTIYSILGTMPGDSSPLSASEGGNGGHDET